MLPYIESKTNASCDPLGIAKRTLVDMVSLRADSWCLAKRGPYWANTKDGTRLEALERMVNHVG